MGSVLEVQDLILGGLHQLVEEESWGAEVGEGAEMDFGHHAGHWTPKLFAVARGLYKSSSP